MSIAFTAYEFYGAPTGNNTSVSANRQTTGDLSFRAITDPNKIYFLDDIQRPLGINGSPFIACSMQRYFSFLITGRFAKLKNVKVTIKKPSLFNKVGGVMTAVSGDDTALMYKMTNQYANQGIVTNDFGISNGAFDGDMNIVTEDIILRPRISSISPAFATSRPAEFYQGAYWTEFIVLQVGVFPGAYANVGNFGKLGSTLVGVAGPTNITGPLLTIEADELGEVYVT